MSLASSSLSAKSCAVRRLLSGDCGASSTDAVVCDLPEPVSSSSAGESTARPELARCRLG